MILILIFLLTACTEVEAADLAVEERVPVETSEPKLDDIKIETFAIGSIEPAEETWILSSIGEIDSILVQVGQVVEKGDVLFTLKQTSKENNLRTTESSLRTAVDNFEAQLEDLKDQLVKNKILYESGAVSKATLDQISLQIASTERQVKDAKTAYGNSISSLRDDLNSGYVTANEKGLVTEIEIKEGMTYQNTPAVLIESIDLPIVNVAVSLEQRKVIDEMTEVKIKIDKAWLMGQILEIKQKENTSIYKVKVQIREDMLEFYTGQVVDVAFKLDERKGLLLPLDSVIEKNDEHFVYIEEEGLALKQTIEIGSEVGDMIEVVSGLEENMNVIVNGQRFVKDKSLVSVFNN